MKIRAWHKINREWISFEELFKTDQHWQNPFTRDDLILVRSTELNDKNGKEIWEGDVVRWNEEFTDSGIEERVSQVKYLGHGFFPMCASYFESIKNCEVLGNVWENPELLK